MDIKDVVNVDWNAGGCVHNWRNHVGEQVLAIWDEIPFAIRLAIAMDAEVKAGNEEWD